MFYIEAPNFEEIGKTALFTGIDGAELPKIFSCLHAMVCHYRKDGYIIRSGDREKRFGIVLDGRVFVLAEEHDGSRTILADRRKNEIFGTSVAVEEDSDSLSIVAAGDHCRVLIIDIDTIFWDCSLSFTTHQQLLFNLARVLALSNLRMMRKFRHISQHSLRKKIVSYLTEQSELANSHDFSIDFDRQGMADYLGADRSALSAELSKMRKEELLSFRKNSFILKDAFFHK
ncbi:MAG TPA: Crp/Fnr family transcriptional regulator [Clostridiales bacterium]|nr:Crp/Fnr family transcriptional regulator [Clostridiales bacterium]